MKAPRAFRSGAFPHVFWVFALMATTLAPASAHAARLANVALPPPGTTPQVFTVSFDGAVQFRNYDRLLTNGYYYLDFYGVTGSYPQQEWRLGDQGIAVVRQIYYAQHKVLRFVFYTFQTLETTVELTSPSAGVFRLTSRSFGAGKLGDPGKVKPPGSRKIVFIDPGHGGHNNGAESYGYIGGRKYYEKDLVLAIARRMIPLFQRSPNLDIRLSRVDDRYVSLDDRIRMSDVAKADLFVSIHLNATDSRRKTARGFEVFYLSDERRATNRWLEVMENTQGVHGGGAQDDKHLRQILTEISDGDLAARRAESQLLSSVIERTFARQGPFRQHIRGSKPATFRVLMNYRAPAALVEVGFLDNAQDAGLLVQPQVQSDIAALLFNAINLYFARTDPDFQPYMAPVSR